MSIKEIVLKKGWAGQTISRAETISQLNPPLQVMSNLLHAYRLLSEENKDISANLALHDQVRVLSMDIGKMSETVASCGGVPTRSPETSLFTGPIRVSDIASAEKSLLSSIRSEKDVEHQMRTRAILSKIAENTESRLEQLSRSIQP